MENGGFLNKEEFLEKFSAVGGHDGRSQNIIQGYFVWKSDGVYYSPNLGPCPYIKMPKGTRVFPNETYDCPFPIGPNKMWSGRLLLPSVDAMEKMLDELGFGGRNSD